MFQYENEAKQFYELLLKRLAKFGLEVEQNKTRILPFGRFKGTKETFDFLGFMHYNGKTRNGKYTVGHKMAKKKRKAKHKSITNWIKDNRTMDIIELIGRINIKLRGMYSYYGINGMWKELYKLYYHTRYALISAMMRRSQRKKTYSHMLCIFKRIPLIEPKIYKDIWCWKI